MSDRSLAADRKRRIAGRARTLRERLDAPAEGGPAVENPGEWLAEWRDRVADGDEAAFRRRLKHLGVSEAEARAALATHGWLESEPLPDWVDDLDAVVAAVTAAERGPPADAPDDVPFLDVLAPVVAHARDRVDRSVAPAELPAVADALEPWLYDRLSSLAAHSLFVEFKTYVAHHDRDLAMADDPDPPEDDRRHYRGFVDAMLGDGFGRFIEEYALLARLLTTTVRQWVAVVEEFAAALAADRSTLRDRFGDGDDLGPIESVEAAGDRHDDGRAVLAVTFESGVRVAYKPRSLTVEAAFYDLLDWLAEHTDLPAIDRPGVLARDDYGWLGWVESDSCPDRAAVERYYRRAGVLLGVLCALRFTDGHLENLVAAGEHPVVVDLETLANPVLPDGRRPGKNPSLLRGTVLRTGLLPVHDPDSDLADRSGFGSDELPAEGERREFTAVNTDLMDMAFVDGDAETLENLPRVDGETVAADDHVEALRGGLRDAHDALVANREVLLADDGPFAALDDAEVRVIYRATRTYSTVLSSLTTPEYLRTGLKAGCKLEALARPQATGTADAPWRVHDHETAALERLDAPRFSTRTTGTALRGPADPVPEFAALSPRDAVADGLHALDPTDRREQCRYVDLAFGERADGTDHGDVADGRPLGGPAPLSDDDARHVATGLLDRVSAAVVADDDGTPGWFVPAPHRDGGVLLQQTDDGLYRGRLGVAAFAAGVAATTDGAVADDAAALATDAAEGVRAAVTDGAAPDSLGVTGVGGLVYGFAVLDDLLDGDDLADARQLAATVTDERLAASDHCVMDGTAGAALGCLALHDRTGDRDALDRAVACGEHLLRGRSGGHWPLGDQGQPLTGFAHGAAGVGYALARLADATGDDRFRDAALETIAFENEQYDPASGDWAGRSERADGTVDGWCDGRTGIGLARLGTLSALPGDSVRRDAERAVSGAPADRIPPYDHACCGAASWIALFQTAGRRLDIPAYEQRARRIAGAAVPGTDDDGWALQSGTPTRPNPTLFRGLGGVGYQLLRLSNPELPSVLLFE